MIVVVLGLTLTGFFYTEDEKRDGEPPIERQEEAAVSLDVIPEASPWREFFEADTSSLDLLASSYDFSYKYEPERLEEPVGEEDTEDREQSGDVTLPEEPVKTPDVRVPGMPALAIVIDDCGFSMEYARRVRACGLPITWAIIPKLRFSGETADMLTKDGIPFLIHVPMQAYVDPDGASGKKNAYAIGVGMGADAVREALVPLLDSLPDAYGINNHRGSKATSDRATMEHVMNILAERKLFFMDSSTSSKTVAHRTALAHGLDSVKNNYFLDNESDREKIKIQLDRAIAGAKAKGSAVAICHLRPETIAFLETVDSAYFEKRGVRPVTLPQLVELRKGDGTFE